MSRHFVTRLAVASVVFLGAGIEVRAGTNQTYTPPFKITWAGNLSLGTPTDLWWANSYTAPTGGEYLTRIDASFGGGLPVGTPISLAVYEDPSDSNNPSDLQLLQQISGTVANGNGDISSPQAFSIPATYVSGDYFVAVQANNVSATQGIPVSSTNPQGRSYIAYNADSDVGTMTVANVENADQPPTQIENLLSSPPPAPTYNFFIGARGRATQYAEAQDPFVFDDFNTGNVSYGYSNPYSGGETAAPGAIGGQRGLDFVTSLGSGSSTVANGVLTITGGQADIIYGYQYTGNGAYEEDSRYYMHANAGGYDTMQFHFLEDNTAIQMIIFGGNNGAPKTYTTDANGNLDFNIAGQDWMDLNVFSFTIYSYGGSVSLDSITLLTNPIPGDVNGDGLLNADDYALIDYGYAAHLSGHIYGDLNGDGVVNAADYLIIDTAFAEANGDVLSPDLLAEREAEFGAGYVSELEAAVPEPASLAACGLALPLFIRRKRKM